MDVRKLWDNAEQSSGYNSSSDVYGAEHLARLLGKSWMCGSSRWDGDM